MTKDEQIGHLRRLVKKLEAQAVADNKTINLLIQQRNEAEDRATMYKRIADRKGR